MKNPLLHTLRAAAVGAALLAMLPLAFTDPAGAAATTPAAGSALRLPAAPAQDSSQSIWSLVPTTDTNGQDRVSLRHEIEPGSAAKDSVVLTNHGSATADFAVYASDGVITEEGQFDIRGGSVEPQDSGSWITFDDSLPENGTLTLKAGDSATIGFEITVPQDATPGDHPAGVVAAIGGTESKAGQLAVESRVGTRIHLRVAGEVQASLGASAVETRYEGSWNPLVPGRMITTTTLSNDGNVRLGANARTTAGGPFGLLEREGTEASWRELLPGDSVELESVTEGVWPLFWVGGSLDIAPQVVGEDVVEGLSTIKVPVSAVAIGWSQLTILVLLAGTVVLVIRRRKAGAARREAELAQALAQARAEGALEAAEARR